MTREGPGGKGRSGDNQEGGVEPPWCPAGRRGPKEQGHGSKCDYSRTSPGSEESTGRMAGHEIKFALQVTQAGAAGPDRSEERVGPDVARVLPTCSDCRGEDQGKQA